MSSAAIDRSPSPRRFDSSLPPIVAGDFEVRLARDEADVDASQALRYRVFYEEMAARPTPEMQARKRDFDEYDELCDHLLMIDRRRSGAGGLTAHVQDVGAFFNQLQRVSDRRCGSVVLAAVGETIGRDIDDAHNERSSIELQHAIAAAELMRKHEDGLFECGV
jgi:hypothetical protein